VNDDLAAQLAIEKPFVVPSSFVYLAKAFSTIEGICIKLDPDFNYFTYLEPLIQQQIIESVNVGDIFMKTTEIPGTIGKINTAVSGLQKSRGSMKRTMIKTRQEIKIVQYSVVCALLAEKCGDNPPLAMFFVLCTLWFTFRKNQ
jgi:predicted unusual protein kinase regulating ubiquinone biosynthesis (AarF/ABC1/UbiB family)